MTEAGLAALEPLTEVKWHPGQLDTSRYLVHLDGQSVGNIGLDKTSNYPLVSFPCESKGIEFRSPQCRSTKRQTAADPDGGVRFGLELALLDVEEVSDEVLHPIGAVQKLYFFLSATMARFINGLG